ncbi:MAG TPA: hypothetical protein PKJ28_01305 [Bacteroidales bacterium]|nr:hypothetical protein [Bacteroidales bacterium]HPS72747.1 hypothetical protein [Bacteroidales bacterium]
MKKLIALSLTLLTAVSLHAQDSWDALRYSRISFSGTSRYIGLGGSSGAVGADLSLLATNPAGLGFYKSFEFTFTPGVSVTNTWSSYNDAPKNRDYQSNFAFNNMGFVFSFPSKKSDSKKGFRNFNIGFAMNRQNDYNSATLIAGDNHASSLVNVFTDELNLSGVSQPNIRAAFPFDIGLAYDCQLIYFDSLNNQYTCDMPQGGVYQEKSIITSGSLTEYDISAGGNIADKVYIGLTMGIASLHYEQDNYYYEFDSGDSIPYFKSMKYQYGFTTGGTGINFKAGVIYRPVEWFRAGLAFHSPTWYADMEDTYSSAMAARYDSILNPETQYSPYGYFNYEMKTPYRVIGSVAFFIGQRGFISGEYEYVNYSQAKFHDEDGSFREVNKDISSNFKAPLNFRLGSEWVFGPFRVRGGFGYSGKPETSGITGVKYTASCGAGYFSRHFFTDVAYQWTGMNGEYYLYQSDLVNAADIWQQSSLITATLGFRL